MATRSTVLSIGTTALTVTSSLPTNGWEVGSYNEGVLFLKIDVTSGSWVAKVESYDNNGDWYELKDAWGATTQKTFTSGAGQTAVWQLSLFGKLIRLKLTVSGTEAASVTRMVFIGKTHG